jgi:GNAT superfamily N-acetyltransferase
MPAVSIHDYNVRPAAIEEIDLLVQHRIAMFTEMGTAIDADSVAAAFRNWVTRSLADGTYRSWVVEAASGQIVAGGGLTIIPWPPGPWHIGGRIAFIYNVYTEPAHRRRGIARMIMEAIHGWCRNEGIGLTGLNASGQAQGLYESMGYVRTAAPMMMASLAAPDP